MLLSGSPIEDIQFDEGPFLFNSYNYPAYAIGIKNSNEGYIIRDGGHHFLLISPGLTGQEGTVSLESKELPGYYLRHRGFLLYLHERDSSDLFQEDSTFIINEGTFYEVMLHP